MSYGISLVRGDSTADFPSVTDSMLPKGGTYASRNPGQPLSESDLEFNITYNFSWYYYETMGERGIREIYGKKGSEAKPLLEKAISDIGNFVEDERKTGKILSQTWGKGNPYDEDEADRDYWYPCAKNARKALLGLVSLCDIAPDFTFTGD